MAISWQGQVVQIIPWNGTQATKTELTAALTLTGRQVVYVDGWAVVVSPNGGAAPRVTMARQNPVEYVVPATGEVLTAGQVRDRFPGAIP